MLARMTADFYAARAADFSATRQGSWAGWQQLAAQVQPLFEEAARMGCPVAVADVACGNGRFGKFLRQKFPQSPLRYTGWDGNEALLREAAANMPEGAALHWADVLAPLLGEERGPWWSRPTGALASWWPASAFCTTSPVPRTGPVSWGSCWI